MSTELAPALTSREARWVRFVVVDGMSESAAMLACGFKGYRDDPGRFPSIVAMRAEVERMKVDLTAHAAAETLIDAGEIHEQLTDELRGALSELYNPRDPLDSRFNPGFKAGELLPIDLWPMWAQQGGVEVTDEPNLVHSTDGENSSWDVQGRKIRIRMVPGHRAKMKELAMKHKGVNAMVQERKEENHLHLHGNIVEILQSALARKARIVEATNVTP